MTAVVGVQCTNGVVVGTDSAVTFASGQKRTVEQATEKLRVIQDRVIVAGTGSVGLKQRFCAVVDSECDDRFYNRRPNGLEAARELARATIQDFEETGARQGQFGALVAYPVKTETYLCEFSINDFQPEMKRQSGIWYCSMGSSQGITDPFLGFIRRVVWDDEPPNVNQGQLTVTWALDHAVELNPGGVNDPISVAVLEHDEDAGAPRARRLGDTELQELRQSIGEAEGVLHDYFAGGVGREAAEDIDVPEPENGEA